MALLHHAGPVFTRSLAEAMSTEPLVRFDGPAGLEQEVWLCPEPTATALADELGAATHYIADGHHRVAATVAGWQAAGGVPERACPASSTRWTGCPCPPSTAGSRARWTPTGCWMRSRSDFVVEPAAGPPDCAGQLGVYVAGQWSTVDLPGRAGAGHAGLDVAILHDRVLGPLGVEERVLPLRLPVEELTAACDGDDGLLVTLAPPTLDLLIDVADRGEVMPPKTTYFDPKPCAGIFLRG